METSMVVLLRKTGTEAFATENAATGFSLSDYWSWAHSDLVNNAERGKIAEFIVASALGIADKPSTVWDSFDLLYNGKGIEVKSAAYLQSWRQKKESYISFSVRPTVGLVGDTGTYDNDRKRQSHAYVFCLLKHKDKQTVNPLNLDQWEFYIVPTTLLNKHIPTQKTIVFSFFERYGISPCNYSELRANVDMSTPT